MQKDNVRNQRENLIILLANVHIRLNPKPEPMNKVGILLTIFFVCTVTFSCIFGAAILTLHHSEMNGRF